MLHDRQGNCQDVTLAKSNFFTLRYRELVYHNLRKLAMSYSDGFLNVNSICTLGSYTRPLQLVAYDRTGWLWSYAGANMIEKRLLQLHRYPQMTLKLRPLWQRLIHLLIRLAHWQPIQLVYINLIQILPKGSFFFGRFASK